MSVTMSSVTDVDDGTADPVGDKVIKEEQEEPEETENHLVIPQSYLVVELNESPTDKTGGITSIHSYHGDPCREPTERNHSDTGGSMGTTETDSEHFRDAAETISDAESNSRCLICYEEYFEVENAENEDLEAPAKLFNVFCKYMEIQCGSDHKVEYQLFCNQCAATLRTLLQLDAELETLRLKTKKIALNCTITLLKSYNPRVRSTGTHMVDRIRSQIFTCYNPRVSLRDRNRAYDDYRGPDLYAESYMEIDGGPTDDEDVMNEPFDDEPVVLADADPDVDPLSVEPQMCAPPPKTRKRVLARAAAMSAEEGISTHFAEACSDYAAPKTKKFRPYRKQAHRPGGKKTHVCHVCKKRFAQPRQLRLHSYTHSKEKRFVCDTCGASFRHPCNLTTHRKTVHNPSSTQNQKQGDTCEKKDCVNLIIKCKLCEFSRKRTPHWRLMFSNHLKNKHDLEGKEGETEYIPDVEILHENELVFTKVEERLVCIKCNNRPVKPHRLKEHIANHGGDGALKNHVCEVCNKSFAHPGQLRLHAYIHSEKKQFVCDTCGVSYKQLTNLTWHTKTVHGPSSSENQEGGDKRMNAVNLIVKCKLCEFSQKRSRQWRMVFTNHMQTKHNLDGKDGESKYMPDVEILHEGEIIFIKAGDQLVCTKCNNLPVEPHRVKDHMAKHGATKKPHVCTVCNKSFALPSHLKVHSYIHSEEKRFVCETCGASFKQPSNLNSHIKNMHEPRSRNTVCETCGKNFRNPRDLKNHMLTHSEGRPLQCEICGATFKLKSSLYNHTKNRHRDKDTACYFCEQCGKQFKQESDLIHHAKVHAIEKPFECQICEKKFAWEYLLKIHLRTHDESIKIPCPHCSARFTVKTSVKKHIEKCHPGLSA